MASLIAISVFELSYSNTQWNTFSAPFKTLARNWFIGRAEAKQIPWTQTRLEFESRMDELQKHFDTLVDDRIFYPSYYTQPFHGYDDGNLNWMAACEMLGSTLSMTSAYWPDTNYTDSAKYVRGNFTDHIMNYRKSAPKRILDVGCSTGISTKHLANTFLGAHTTGIDLSPYFLSVAMNTLPSDINLQHANAEHMPFEDESYDLVCASYLFHELPVAATRSILNQCKRVLKNQGTLAIVDLDPALLRARLVSPFRKWAFEATEPHILDYYTTNMYNHLEHMRFDCVESHRNDPLNTVWMATKR